VMIIGDGRNIDATITNVFIMAIMMGAACRECSFHSKHMGAFLVEGGDVVSSWEM